MEPRCKSTTLTRNISPLKGTKSGLTRSINVTRTIRLIKGERREQQIEKFFSSQQSCLYIKQPKWLKKFLPSN